MFKIPTETFSLMQKYFLYIKLIVRLIQIRYLLKQTILIWWNFMKIVLLCF